MKTSGLHRIERKSSIESEPLTLHIDEIQFAREAALYVVNTKSIEEALAIFTEGLQTVVSTKQRGADERTNSEEECDHVVPYLRLPPLLGRMRDVVTAPF